jgi:hypothetical protein
MLETRMSMRRIVKQSTGVAYGWGIIQMKVSFLDALTMISLGIRQSKQALFQEVAVQQSMSELRSDRISRERGHTLSRSKTQKRYFLSHGYPRHQQFHPRPTDMFLTGSGRGKNLTVTDTSISPAQFTCG